MDDSAPRQFEVLLTAQEAFPALEAQFLQAEREIIAGFRIFDPWTRLRSPEARRVGTTWFDLIVATLDRGVRITLTLSDFDPVARPGMHAYAWACVRGLLAAGEASRNPDLLSARASMHPARVGLLPRFLLWPRSIKEINENLAQVNRKSSAEKDAYLTHSPYLRPMLRWDGDRIVPRFAPPPLVPVTHHQKLAVFDEKTLYVGGLDLNDRRYDTPEHERAADQTWHDTQVLVSGPIAAEAAAHLRTFEGVTLGADPAPKGNLLRTISAKRGFSLASLSPKPVVRELAEAHAAQIAQSKSLIYLETQFFRDRTLAKQLARRAAQVPELALILILPAAPEDAAFDDAPGSDVAYGEHLQIKSLEIIKKAFGKRLFVGSPAQLRPAANNGRATHFGAPLVYLHAKVSIFDDRAGIVSSANLNGRSMSWDTEVGVQTGIKEDVEQLKTRCFDHWLGADAGPEYFACDTACAAWAARAADNAQRRPEQRRGFILPYVADAAQELAYNLPGVPEEMA
ncbi:phospholipase D family protein [Tateyamaria sp. SN3-11]|uniref:phospholipase D family protein n=1 Tax=Tateyamaria sp. SN3-11 TaxID=3092147 RepID=UPI0039EADD21